MVYRIYSEKKEGFRKEAATLRNEIRTLLGIRRLEDVRILSRYDVEGIGEDLFDECRWKVFAEPQTDVTSGSLPGLIGSLVDDNGYVFDDIEAEEPKMKAFVFATEVLPGRFDQRADSAEKCVQIISKGEKPVVRCAKVYVLCGELMPADRDAIMNYVINPAEVREASLEMPETLVEEPVAEEIIRSAEGACSGFDTVIDSATFEDPMLEKAYKDYLKVRKSLGQNTPVTLGDIARIAARYLKREGRLEKLDTSGANCSVMINVEINGENEPWLLFFGSSADNGLTEVRPAAGAAACLEEGLRGVLFERAHPYAVMRLSGADDPLQHAADTLPGRLPQRKLAVGTAEGSSGYASLAGIATGMADEVYHPGFAAKRLESYAVLAAAPSVNIRKEEIEPDDTVMVVLGRGASGYHKMQRLLGDAMVSRMVKKCCDAAPYGYDGMACVIDAENEKLFRLLVSGEDLQCVKAGGTAEQPREDTEAPDRHVDIAPEKPGDWKATSMYGSDRSFTAGMRKIAADLNTCSRRGLVERFDTTAGAGTVLMPFGGANQITPAQAMASKIPAGRGKTSDCSVMAWGYNPFISEASPYHGAYLAVVESVSKLIASGASFKDIYLCLQSSFAAPGDDGIRWGRPLAAMLGAFKAQMDLGLGAADCKGSMDGTYEGINVPPALISFAVTMAKTGDIRTPEFKEAGHKVVLLKPREETDDSGSGKGLPNNESLMKVWEKAAGLLASGEAFAAYTPGIGGIAEAIMKMTYGNGIGFGFEAMDLEEIFSYSYGSMILEVEEDLEIDGRNMDIEIMGHTTKERTVTYGAEKVSLAELLTLYEGRLEGVYPAVTGGKGGPVSNIEYRARSWHTPVFKRAEPKVLIPVFPGTNCEEDTARVIREAGASAEIMIIKDQSADDLKRSAEAFASAMRGSQILMIPGGNSACGEPDGSAKLITAFFRQDEVAEVTMDLLEKKDGLICGICDGFQALIKLGLVPYGKITETGIESPTLAMNSIGRCQSKIVRVRIASNKSPWLRYNKVGDIYCVPVSYAEGRFTGPDEVVRHLAAVGQIATQYVDHKGDAAADIRFNPGGSMMAAEGITSPDGRVFGRMGHAERAGNGLYRNVPGDYFFGMFENAVKYYK